MDPAFYKDHTTSRGYNYHYYRVLPKDNNINLVFIHGFPSTSHDWRLIVPYFQEEGYGIIVPDMLGYRGTDKPTNFREYQYSLLTRDVVDIMDQEGVERAVAIGHDWGAHVVSRFSNFFPERFLAYATLSLPYHFPRTDFEMESFMASTKEAVGYEPFGYWYFFAEEGAAKIIEENMESFLAIMFPQDLSWVRSTFNDRGGVKAALLRKHKTALQGFMTEEEQKIFAETFWKGGLAAPLSYYTIMVTGARNEDDAKIPESRRIPPLSSPLFFGAGLKDGVCHPTYGKAEMTREELKNHNVTIREFDGDHWIMLSPDTADKINQELELWIENVVLNRQRA
ncbi:hypothetical protein EIP91_003774 [Steccherinum ochraceum]|uniref:AB hydrolase-1 domain-containing protein n=1 Tax=Steccherinum ochraceum TaxID=92696 RepID=A0A4R0RA03_9APHY|nr:hypothetical protein EIP91_003774 [Steccherinum ochraceum]